jgi:hypothetical protein
LDATSVLSPHEMRQLTDVCWRDSQHHVTRANRALLHYLLPATNDRLLPQTSPNAAGAARGQREEQQSVFVHALSGAASFAAAIRLFRTYPLAVSSCSPERWSGDGWHRSIVLQYGTDFYVLSQDPAEHFVLRPWGDGDYHEIRPVALVPAAVHEVLTEGMPVPRDGALLGWVSDRQASVLLSVYHGHPDGPQIRVLPKVGSEPIQWPPFTIQPLDDGRLWQYLDRGELVDLAPILTREPPGCAFWVPSQNAGRASHAHGCVVVRQSLPDDEFWLPAGVYMDHWMLREGVPAPPASHLLALPGAVDLSRRLALTTGA